MKVIIAGSRSFKDYEKLCEVCDHMLSRQTDVEIVSGVAKGADELGERYALERKFIIRRFFPDWKLYGRAAGPKRNEQMAIHADALIAFWDGKSRGIKSMIEVAKKQGIKVKVQEYI